MVLRIIKRQWYIYRSITPIEWLVIVGWYYQTLTFVFG